MIDFGDFIKSQYSNVGFPQLRKKKINEITNRSITIEEAKEKVRNIIENGKKRRKKNEND